jgi:hypothetical protein
MKYFTLPSIITVFQLFYFNGIQAQTTFPDSPKAGSDYNVLDAWAGTWNIKGEARDSASGPNYHVDWTLNGKRILNGFALEISHKWETKSFTQYGFEVTGYDPRNKICITRIFYNDGSWLNSTPSFTGRRTCIENGVTYYPTGKVEIWRYTWIFSDDWMSLNVQGEVLKDNIWFTAFEGRGIKSPAGDTIN